MPLSFVVLLFLIRFIKISVVIRRNERTCSGVKWCGVCLWGDWGRGNSEPNSGRLNLNLNLRTDQLGVSLHVDWQNLALVGLIELRMKRAFEIWSEVIIGWIFREI